MLVTAAWCLNQSLVKEMKARCALNCFFKVMYNLFNNGNGDVVLAAFWFDKVLGLLKLAGQEVQPAMSSKHVKLQLQLAHNMGHFKAYQ